MVRKILFIPDIAALEVHTWRCHDAWYCGGQAVRGMRGTGETKALHSNSPSDIQALTHIIQCDWTIFFYPGQETWRRVFLPLHVGKGP